MMAYHYICLYSKSQRWNKHRIYAYQDRMLGRLLKHAGENVPYYRKLFSEIGFNPERFRGKEDMDKIPVLDKETFRQRKSEFIAKNAERFLPSLHKTSGSTGTALKFLLDVRASVHDAAAALRSYSWAGYYPGMKLFSVKDHLKKWEYKYSMMGRILNFDSNSVSQQSALRIWAEINRLKPFVFRSYPFTLMMLYRYGLKAGIQMHKPKTIITTGESLPDSLRKKLESCYKAAVFDYYGMTENAAMITECEYHNYHVIEDYAWHEFLDPGSEKVLKEGRGEIIATGFYNYSMPLIRYRTGDYAWIQPEKDGCACGRNFRIVKKIEGRKEDYIKTPEGVRLNLIETPLNVGIGIMMGQYVQDHPDHMYINIVPGPDFEKESLKAVEKDLRKLVGNSMSIDFRIVEVLENRGGTTGKVPFIYSKIGKSLYE
ncbi:MAG: hypothetical protein R6U19_08570 [Bacteroidales bacterium]